MVVRPSWMVTAVLGRWAGLLPAPVPMIYRRTVGLQTFFFGGYAISTREVHRARLPIPSAGHLNRPFAALDPADDPGVEAMTLEMGQDSLDGLGPHHEYVTDPHVEDAEHLGPCDA